MDEMQTRVPVSVRSAAPQKPSIFRLEFALTTAAVTNRRAGFLLPHPRKAPSALADGKTVRPTVSAYTAAGIPRSFAFNGDIAASRQYLRMISKAISARRMRSLDRAITVFSRWVPLG